VAQQRVHRADHQAQKRTTGPRGRATRRTMYTRQNAVAHVRAVLESRTIHGCTVRGRRRVPRAVREPARVPTDSPDSGLPPGNSQ
jgi:hypothetical protein